MSVDRGVTRRTEAVVRATVRRLAQGDRLPSEREFTEQVEASRTTVRLVLSRLRAEGLIEARHGSGYYVRRSRTP